MHDNFVLVEGGVGCFVDDVVNDGLVVGACVEQAKAIEGSPVGVVVDSISSVVFWQKFREMRFIAGVLEDESERCN